jgi:hypothetical protein
MKKGTMATIKIFQKTLSSSWKITIQEYDLRARRRRKASQRSGRVTCKMSVFNPKRHPRAPTHGAETIHGSARRTRGRKAPCPESLRAFRSPGFWRVRRRAALRLVNWTSARTVYTVVLTMNRATEVLRRAHHSAHPEQLGSASTCKRGRGVIAPNPVPSPVREDSSVRENWPVA